MPCKISKNNYSYIEARSHHWKKGSDIEKLKKDIGNISEGDDINIVEIKKSELDSQLVADNIAQQLERRVAFRRAMKRAVQSAMRLGALVLGLIVVED